MRVRLRPGADVDRALQILDTLSTNAYTDAIPGPATNAEDHRGTYLRWLYSTENQLTSFLLRQDALLMLDTPRSQAISQIPAGKGLVAMINAELNAKAEALREVHASLKADRDRMRDSPGLPCVLDTNVLLQCKLPDQIPWAKVTGEPARLMLPLRVIEEIDAKKYGESERLRNVARTVLPWIDSLFKDQGPGPVPVREDATLELLFPDTPRYRPQDADEEVLEELEHVHSLTGRGLLITGDTGMRLRARAMGKEVLLVPDSYRR
jgi:hypothetical protein